MALKKGGGVERLSKGGWGKEADLRGGGGPVRVGCGVMFEDARLHAGYARGSCGGDAPTPRPCCALLRGAAVGAHLPAHKDTQLRAHTYMTKLSSLKNCIPNF